MTTAQRLHDQGVQQGISQGQAQLLVAMLETRFGSLDADIRDRIANATTDEITGWSLRIARGAETLAEILD